jgi:hypothetical protein
MVDTSIDILRRASPKTSSGDETGIRLPGTQTGSVPVSVKESHWTAGSLALAPVIEIDKLYPATRDSKSQLVTAIGLLADAIELLSKARIAAQKSHSVEADRFTQRFEAILPDLFRCRRVGDGYGVIINSLHFAAINKNGEPFSLDELTTVWRILKELRNSPFVEFEQALDYVEEFENCGLRVDPPIVSEMLESLQNE